VIDDRLLAGVAVALLHLQSMYIVMCVFLLTGSYCAHPVFVYSCAHTAAAAATSGALLGRQGHCRAGGGGGLFQGESALMQWAIKPGMFVCIYVCTYVFE